MDKKAIWVLVIAVVLVVGIVFASNISGQATIAKSSASYAKFATKATQPAEPTECPIVGQAVHYTVEKNGVVSLQIGSGQSVSATCPSGMKVISGSCATHSGAELTGFGYDKSNINNACYDRWYCLLMNTEDDAYAGDHAYSVSAICIN